MKWSLFFSLLAVRAFAQSDPARIRPVPGHPVWEPKIHVTLEEIAQRMQYFDLVVVVNKASSAQTIEVFKKIDGQPKEILNSRISSGVEEYSCHYPVDKRTGYVLSKAIFTQTPAGYYTVQNLDIDHFSGAYDDAHMPFAVFMYDPTGAAAGIATHVAPGGTEHLIGHRESHGCIRLSAPDAQEVFKQVLHTGGPVDLRNGDFQAKCNPARGGGEEEDPYCYRRPDTRQRESFYRGWLRANVQPTPYSAKPMIPLIDRKGDYAKDETGELKMRPGYKTLYIIESVETAEPTSQVFRGIRRIKRGGKTVEEPVFRPARLEPVHCRSEQSVNDDRNPNWNGDELPAQPRGWRGYPPPPPFPGGFPFFGGPSSPNFGN